MASLAQQVQWVKWSTVGSKTLSNSKYMKPPPRRAVITAAAVPITNAHTRERMKLKQMFAEANERCHKAPMEGMSFTIEDFEAALNTYDVDSGVAAQISTAEELHGQEIPDEFVEVDEEESKLVVVDGQAQLEVGSVVIGTVESVKPYGAFIKIGAVVGLLHVDNISNEHVSDIANVLHLGDTLKVMILSHDRERGKASLSTKKLEPTPGDMTRNPELVFEKAEEMAQIYRERIAEAEMMARADLLRFQPPEVEMD